MWIKIKETITTDNWYRNHKGELFEVYVVPNWRGEDPEPVYVVEIDTDIFIINADDADIVEVRREKLNKIKNKL